MINQQSKPLSKKSQRGLIGILLLVTIAVMAVAVFSKTIWGDDAKTYQQKVNQEALRQAKAALLDYLVVGAVSGGIGDPFSASNLGRLPCPNQDGNGASASPCGIGTAYLAAGYHSLGLLPWATINSPIIRDASRQCLWYAVDGLYKVSNISNPVNSDSYGSFSVVQPVKSGTWLTQVLAGDLTTVGSSLNRVVAVIIASGSAGGTQAQTSVGGSAYACGLTRTDANGKPNAEASAPDFLKYYSATINNQSLIPSGGTPVKNAPNPAATASGALVTFVTADIGQEQLNDQVVWITADEVAKATTQRIAQLYANQLTVYAKATGFYPWAASTPGGNCVKGLLQGFIPYDCDVLTTNATSPTSKNSGIQNPVSSLSFGSSNFYTDLDYWAGQAHYAVSKHCSPTTSSAKKFSNTDYPTVGSGGSNTNPCALGSDRIDLGAGTNGPAAIILMRGRALPSQRTGSTATQCVPYDKTNISTTSNISNCLEDATNKLTVNTAFTSPKSNPTLMYGSAPYRVPQASSSNDYMVQLAPTLN